MTKSLTTIACLWCVVLFGGCVAGNVMRPSCSGSASRCEFDFTVSHWSTMMYSRQGPGPASNWHPVIFQRDGTVVARKLSSTCDNDTMTLDDKELSSVVTADGSYKMMMLVNGQLPGPPIVVYQGQQVVVRITNNLINDAFTMHWHGIEQKNTPWMDGGGHVSQFAIEPNEVFTYRFAAEPVGTHWYHAHEGVQRSQGAFGPCIVLPRKEDRSRVREKDPPPEFASEFLMTIQDFHHQSSLEFFHQWSYGTGAFANGYGNLDKYAALTRNVDGFQNSFVPFTSALINGKGRHYPMNSSVADNPMLPLEVFAVHPGQKYRFRLINAALTAYLRVSIDAHALYVIASDGWDVREIRVDSLIIAPGERYDFWILADDPDGLSNYWIRVDTIEWYSRTGNERISPGHSEAILKYGLKRRGDPVSIRQLCTADSPCHVLNCPFRHFPRDTHTECVPLMDLRAPVRRPTLTPKAGPFLEHFLNFHVEKKGNDAAYRATINDIQFADPLFPLQTDPSREVEGRCTTELCENGCSCVNILDLPLGHVVQMVLFITATPGELHHTSHPVHIHARQFQVVKVSWPEYDATTGLFISQNADIVCPKGRGGCPNGHWRDRSWEGGHVPGIVTEGAILKDTVIVPVGGYVVIRFKTANPGFWFMHCHMEMHNANGMALVIKEGTVADMKPMPKSLDKHCRAYTRHKETSNTMLIEIERKTRINETTRTQLRPFAVSVTNDPRKSAAVVFLGVVSLCLLIACIYLVTKLRHAHAYTLIPH